MVGKRLLAGIVLGGLALAGCSGRSVNDDNNAGNANNAAAKYTVAVVSHGKVGDAFWDIVKNGAEQAGRDLDVAVNYTGDGDPQRQSQLIDNAVSQKVDGIVVSMANPDALKSSVQKAAQAGIPVITINSGQARSAEFGALVHIGQSEDVAGQAAGGRLKDAGARHALCVIHEAGNIGLEQRCAGVKQTFGGTVDNLQVDVSDLAGASSRIKARLQQDTSIDAVLTLNGGVGMAARDAIKGAGSSARLGTFDLNGDVVNAIKAGEMLFAVDQQPYLQGYLGVQFLYLYKTNLNVVGGGRPVLTGPGFVTKDNVEQIGRLADQGTR